MKRIQSDNGEILIGDYPDKCPFCHNKITPNPLYGHWLGGVKMEVMLYCPNQQCKKSFIGYYFNNPVTNSTTNSIINIYYSDGETTKGNLIGKEFSETIKSISESFITIYNQAFSAEQQELTEICGVGYRKALEFLIKDYIIQNKPEEKGVVENKQLAKCISNYIDDNKIKTVASRAVWLGNDETHYIRKWEGKNLVDLKKLIDLTIHWIEMEALTKSIESDMPDNK